MEEFLQLLDLIFGWFFTFVGFALLLVIVTRPFHSVVSAFVLLCPDVKRYLVINPPRLHPQPRLDLDVLRHYVNKRRTKENVMSVTVGDTVCVKGIRSARMLVIDQTPHDDEDIMTCLWFDSDQIARQIGLKSWLLEKVEPGRGTFDTIPVIGYAK